jgi:peptide deformylase
MNFEILQYPRASVLLRRKARPVRTEEFGTPAFQDFVGALAQTMMDARGSGLAATQVEDGRVDGEPLAVFVMRIAPDTWGAVCNPTVVSHTGHQIGAEGCLSFASVAESMAAPEMLMLHGFNSAGAGFQNVFADEMARCVWHEERHLRGLLMIDGMSPMKRGLFLKRVAKARNRR